MNSYRIYVYALFLLSLSYTACKKILGVESPADQLTEAQVFHDERNAEAALLNIYSLLKPLDENLIAQSGAYTDELVYNGSNTDPLQFANGRLQSANKDIANYWASAYRIIYQCNLLSAGLDHEGTGIPDTLRRRIMAEAKFLRAYCYFYLVNCYGDVPLLLSTSVTENSTASRTPAGNVYNQIIKDLAGAATDLPENYRGGGKVRVNKWAAMALLSRTYLYVRDWEKAREVSTLVIRSGRYRLVQLEEIAFDNNDEAIWQLWNPDGYSVLAAEFTPPGSRPTYTFTQDFAGSVETGDRREAAWIGEFNDGRFVYRYPSKYKKTDTLSMTRTEYTVCLRLAEQYLLRAEAYAMEDDTPAALNDINVVRARAGLTDINLPIAKDSCLRLIEKERRMELFTEAAHRFFDLKRTGRADVVLKTLKPAWESWAGLFPIPAKEIRNNPRLTQNPGY